MRTIILYNVHENQVSDICNVVDASVMCVSVRLPNKIHEQYKSIQIQI